MEHSTGLSIEAGQLETQSGHSLLLVGVIRHGSRLVLALGAKKSLCSKSFLNQSFGYPLNLNLQECVGLHCPTKPLAEERGKMMPAHRTGEWLHFLKPVASGMDSFVSKGHGNRMSYWKQ